MFLLILMFLRTVWMSVEMVWNYFLGRALRPILKEVRVSSLQGGRGGEGVVQLLVKVERGRREEGEGDLGLGEKMYF